MPRPVPPIVAAMRPGGGPQRALVAGVERTLARFLERQGGVAFTRAELGDAFKDALGEGAGLRVDRGVRELVLVLAQAMSTPLAGAIQATSDVLDLALTNLVRRGEVAFAIVDLQAHFWWPEAEPTLPEGQAPG